MTQPLAEMEELLCTEKHTDCKKLNTHIHDGFSNCNGCDGGESRCAQFHLTHTESNHYHSLSFRSCTKLPFIMHTNDISMTTLQHLYLANLQYTTWNHQKYAVAWGCQVHLVPRDTLYYWQKDGIMCLSVCKQNAVDIKSLTFYCTLHIALLCN